MVVFEAVGSAPCANLAHVLRWYKHILSYGNDTAGFTGVKKPLSVYGPPSTVAKPSNADDDDDDDDDDLFGSDTEEDKVFRKCTHMVLENPGEYFNLATQPETRNLEQVFYHQADIRMCSHHLLQLDDNKYITNC